MEVTLSARQDSVIVDNQCGLAVSARKEIGVDRANRRNDRISGCLGEERVTLATRPLCCDRQLTILGESGSVGQIRKIFSRRATFSGPTLCDRLGSSLVSGFRKPVL